jgi:tetratricopeptide (TPR) repeat protein
MAVIDYTFVMLPEEEIRYSEDQEYYFCNASVKIKWEHSMSDLKIQTVQLTLQHLLGRLRITVAGIFLLALPCVATAVSIGEIESQNKIGSPLLVKIAVTTASGENIDDSCLSLLAPKTGEDASIDYLTDARLSYQTEGKRQYIVLGSATPFNQVIAKFRLQISCRGIPAVIKTLALLPDLDAVAQLDQELLRYAGTPDYDYKLGMAWYQSGETGQALFAFERVLMVDPENVDARLKIAQIHVERGGAITQARETLAPLIRQNLNPGQQLELDKINSELTEKGNTASLSISGYVLAGAGWDDNVSSGPDSSALIIPALGSGPTSLGTATRAGDLVSLLEGGLTLRKTVADDSWIFAAGSVRKTLDRTRTFNQEGIANFDLGLVKVIQKNFYSLSLQAQNYQIDNQPYRNAVGVRLSVTHPLTDNEQLSGYSQFINFDYPGHPADNTLRKLVGVSHGIRPGIDNWGVEYGAYAGEENAKDPSKPNFSYRLWGIHAGSNILLSDGVSLAVGSIYEPHHHLAEDNLYQRWRVDSLRSLGITVDYRINSNWHWMPQYSHTHNVSNLALYDYTRNMYLLQFKWESSK